jgi:hypothetical protein
LYCGTLVPSLVPVVNKLWFKLQFARNRKNEDISYKQFTFDCLFKQYVNEWAVPTQRAVEAVRALRQLIETKNYNIHFPIEIRFVKSDNIWLSPAYDGDRCCSFLRCPVSRWLTFSHHPFILSRRYWLRYVSPVRKRPAQVAGVLC